MRIAGMWLLCMGCASPDTEEPGPELFGTPPAVPRGPGEFVALNADRAERTAVDLRARTVLWFYPNTAGDTWTLQGCGFRDHYDAFLALDLQVVAVGFESPEANASWIADAEFPYEVWSDDTRALALHHGAATSANQGKAARLTFLLDDDGQVLLEYLDSQEFGAPPLRLLDDAEALWGPGD